MSKRINITLATVLIALMYVAYSWSVFFTAPILIERENGVPEEVKNEIYGEVIQLKELNPLPFNIRNAFSQIFRRTPRMMDIYIPAIPHDDVYAVSYSCKGGYPAWEDDTLIEMKNGKWIIR